jgi:hypothetical protein
MIQRTNPTCIYKLSEYFTTGHNYTQKTSSWYFLTYMYDNKNSTCILEFPGHTYNCCKQGWIQGGGAPPLKLEKIWFFFSHEIPQKFSRLPPQSEKIRFVGVKSWFLPRNIPKIFVFGVKSWFFHTKYPKKFRASLRSAQFF